MATWRGIGLGLGVLAIAGCMTPAQPGPTGGPAPYGVLAVRPFEAGCGPVNPVGQRFTAVLSGAAEVPPRVTPVVGTATLVYTGASGLLTYDLRATGLRNATAAHLHLGRRGENGPMVAVLAGPSAPGRGPIGPRLTVGVLREGDLVGPLAGQPIAALALAIREGRVYVNVHTDDGVAPPNTGPGDFPDGEVRGQVGAETGGEGGAP